MAWWFIFILDRVKVSPETRTHIENPLRQVLETPKHPLPNHTQSPISIASRQLLYRSVYFIFTAPAKAFMSDIDTEPSASKPTPTMTMKPTALSNSNKPQGTMPNTSSSRSSMQLPQCKSFPSRRVDRRGNSHFQSLTRWLLHNQICGFLVL